MKHSSIILVALCMLASFASGVCARELKEPVNFGAYRVGSKARQIVRIDVRVPGGPGFMVSKPSGFVHPFYVADGKGPNGSYPVVDGQFVEVELTFHPTDNGDFTDTLILERPPMGNVVDRILVIVFGRGTRETKIIPVDFTKDDPTIYIGDSIGIKRRVPIEMGDARRIRRVANTRLDAPFYLIISPEIDTQGDEIILGASFEPRQPGVFRDTLAYERLDSIPGNPEPVVLDTIVYFFYGVAKKQPGKFEHTFNVTVNDTPTPIKGSFNVESYTPYTYVGSKLTNGPCSFVSVSNVKPKPNDEDQIDYSVKCTPTTIGTFVDTLVIKRVNATNDTVDQTLVICTTTVRPRPLVLSLALTPASTTANIGDTISLAVVASADHVPDEPALVKNASFTFSYNATVLIPLTSATVSTDRKGDTSTVTLTRTSQEQFRLKTGSDTIGVIRCVVALGNADKDVVQPLNASLEAEQTASTTYTLNAATVLVADVWEHNGGPRLVNSLRGTCDITVSPAPVRTTATMKLTNVPTDVGTLHIVRSSGVVVADLTEDVRKGVREFALTAGSGTGLALSPGTYYARLLVGANGKTVYSVVRMIVVE